MLSYWDHRAIYQNQGTGVCQGIHNFFILRDFTSVQQVAGLLAAWRLSHGWLTVCDESAKAEVLVCITTDCSFLEFH